MYRYKSVKFKYLIQYLINIKIICILYTQEKVPERNVEAVPGPSQSKQGTRFNTKKRIIVGNVSK